MIVSYREPNFAEQSFETNKLDFAGCEQMKTTWETAATNTLQWGIGQGVDVRKWQQHAGESTSHCLLRSH